MDWVKVANSVEDGETTGENLCSLLLAEGFNQSWFSFSQSRLVVHLYKDFEYLNFFWNFILKTCAGDFSTHTGIPGYFLPLNMFVLKQDGCLGSH